MSKFRLFLLAISFIFFVSIANSQTKFMEAYDSMGDDKKTLVNIIINEFKKRLYERFGIRSDQFEILHEEVNKRLNNLRLEDVDHHSRLLLIGDRD